MTKKAISQKYLFCDPSNLSKEIDYDPDKWYVQLFDLENEKSALYGEDEPVLLGALKDFIVKAGLKDTLEDIWDKEYKDFVIEVLRRTNTQPPKEECIYMGMKIYGMFDSFKKYW